MTNRITLQDYFKLFFLPFYFYLCSPWLAIIHQVNRKLLPGWYYLKRISLPWQELPLL